MFTGSKQPKKCLIWFWLLRYWSFTCPQCCRLQIPSVRGRLLRTMCDSVYSLGRFALSHISIPLSLMCTKDFCPFLVGWDIVLQRSGKEGERLKKRLEKRLGHFGITCGKSSKAHRTLQRSSKTHLKNHQCTIKEIHIFQDLTSCWSPHACDAVLVMMMNLWLSYKGCQGWPDAQTVSKNCVFFAHKESSTQYYYLWLNNLCCRKMTPWRNCRGFASL